MKSLFRSLVGLRVLVVAEDVGELLGVGLELEKGDRLLLVSSTDSGLFIFELKIELRLQLRQSREVPLHSSKRTISNICDL